MRHFLLKFLQEPNLYRLAPLLLVVIYVLVACSMSPQSSVQPRSTMIATRISTTQTWIPKPPEPMPASTNVPSTRLSTETPTPLAIPLTTTFNMTKIAARGVDAAFWSDDGGAIIFHMKPEFSENDSKWIAYDITTHLTTTVDAPQRYDPQARQKVKLTTLTGYDGFPYIEGYKSPSGKYIIFAATYGNPSISNSKGRTEVWVADTIGSYKVKLLDQFLGGINQAIWLKDESKVLFDFGYEGNVQLYIADIKNGPAAPLALSSEFDGVTDQIWSVSPDGSRLAFIDLHYRLWIVSLENGKATIIEQSTRYPIWSKDGKSLYYWWGPSFSEAGTLHMYDMASATISTLIDRSNLADVLGAPPPLVFGKFEVSPQGERVLFCCGRLWLIEPSVQ
jgi:hypothetical protein